MSDGVLSRPAGLTVTGRGEVDHATAPALLADLLAAVTEPGIDDVAVDLSAVTFFDCAGAAVLVRARPAAEANGVTLRLVDAS